MGILLNVLSWMFCLFVLLVAVLIFGMGGLIQFIFLLGIVLILLPPFRGFLQKITTLVIPWWVYLLVGLVFLCCVIASFSLNPATSIYKSDNYRKELLGIYDAKLAQWPVPYKTTYVETEYGRIHVIISGPLNGHPVLLINASGLSGWSWIHNVEELSQNYRTFAIDNIGEGGKNEMVAPGKIPKSGQEIADFYTDISNKLGIVKSFVIGASIGGYIATNYALYAPERVEKLILLGSMGYGSTYKTIITMIIAQGIPLKQIQEATFRWAFGNAPQVIKSFGEWFRVYMKGLMPTPIVPTSFTPEQLKKMKIPTLAYFGTYDGVIGDAQKAKELAENIPIAQVKIVESGHVIGAELPELVNKAIIEFFQKPYPEERPLKF